MLSFDSVGPIEGRDESACRSPDRIKGRVNLPCIDRKPLVNRQRSCLNHCLQTD